MDRIDPIASHRPAAEPLPPIRRTGRSDDERERPDPDDRRRRRRPPPPETPPDDGLPHIDVRV